MDAALPEGPEGPEQHIDVGSFDQGNQFSRWALSRYLVGRAIGESVSRCLLVVGLGVLALAALSEWVGHLTALAVLLAVLAIGIFVVRAALGAMLRRFTVVSGATSAEARLRALVRDTHGDVLRELRRLGLPGHTLTLPLLALRLLGRRRAETVRSLRAFDLDNVVPRSRLDELHMIVRASGADGAGPGRMAR